MGRVRNKVVKRAAKQIVSLHYQNLDIDFYHNKLVVEEVAVIQSKRLLNRVAGYTTVLMKRIQKGGVPGIHIKKHEEERERKENFIPSKRVLDDLTVVVDKTTMKMLKEYNYMGNYAVHDSEVIG
ncbi:hypothetical protein EDEG_00766 [Edhazardia aedis USNM 41457]|uniref:Ribosomal protein S17 n=1 Tax=Edhazardia aedis (strain USNM 41457) TaxID=1003232 RepID=J9DRG4_EDHAE|nr:hypothetical protein EDEG_00766 [Edhazardia aedis USNM 41457]|eukprot:EJW05155.1 hypothetical protein EDEG_00766 [Edhazardia aedis USNM 41457]